MSVIYAWPLPEAISTWWVYQRMRGNVQLEKMGEQAEEWAGKVEWMARVDGELEAERGRLIWDLVARPGLEHAAEV